jgi:hypothetical protein
MQRSVFLTNRPFGQKRELTSISVAQNTTPEAIIAQRRAQADAGADVGYQAASGSGERKEKKKGFFKGLFSGKK